MGIYQVKKEDLVGDLIDFPIEVAQKMVECQYKQTNKCDICVFQYNKNSTREEGGFDWYRSVEGYFFWKSVIEDLCFDAFFLTYPLKTLKFECECCTDKKSDKLKETFSEMVLTPYEKTRIDIAQRFFIDGYRNSIGTITRLSIEECFKLADDFLNTSNSSLSNKKNGMDIQGFFNQLTDMLDCKHLNNMEVSSLEDVLNFIRPELELEREISVCSSKELDTYIEFVNYLNEKSIGDKNSLIECFANNNVNVFLGYKTVNRILIEGKLYLEFEVDNVKLKAEWESRDNYGVWQTTLYSGDNYNGYLLFPTRKDDEYFVLYYEC